MALEGEEPAAALNTQHSSNGRLSSRWREHHERTAQLQALRQDVQS